ncbi:type IV toxin-antitoxin system AbiEi family antitoxin domain-containing protein [Raineyella antarctica]|nr:type IV toxin-antitoxin system AbiEi family antitoxin domain-containing protein [Raineyella antarctica]
MRRREQLSARARALVDEQDGIITRSQALAYGVSDRVIQRLVTDGSWQRLDNGIFVVGSAPITWDQWARGGLLWAGEPAALGGEAAGFRYGLVPRPALIDIWVPLEASHRPARPRWRLRYDGVGRLAGAWGQLMTTTVEDTVLDLADAADVDGALAVLTRALAEGRTHEGRMLAALARRPRIRHRALLTDVVSSRKGFESTLEYHLEADVLRPHGLPLGRTQVVTGTGTRVDRLLEEYRLVLEADGRAGHEGEGRFRDMRRDNAHTLRGFRTLRLGWWDIRLNPCDTARGIAEVLRQEGWQGTLRPCRRCRRKP